MVDEEKLIEEVKKYQFLYDLAHPKYGDAVKRDSTWEKIAQDLGYPDKGIICKQRWQCLRDYYRRALNKRRLKAQLGSITSQRKKIKKWKHEHEMEFLAPYLTGKYATEYSGELTSAFEESNEDYDNDEGDATYIEPQEAGASESVNADPLEYGTPLEIADSESDGERYKTNRDSNKLTTILINYLIEELKKTDHDDIDKFFLSIAATVKKFSPYNRAILKQKIFSLVSEMELEHLNPRETSNSVNKQPKRKRQNITSVVAKIEADDDTL